MLFALAVLARPPPIGYHVEVEQVLGIYQSMRRSVAMSTLELQIQTTTFFLYRRVFNDFVEIIFIKYS